MRRVLLLASFVLALIVGPATAASAVDDVFRGAWAGIDSDGSNLTLTIEGTGQAGRHSVTYFDDAATLCGGGPATAQGSGKVEGDTMYVSWTAACRTGGNPFRGKIAFTFEYDTEADTLTDNFGVTYYRTT